MIIDMKTNMCKFDERQEALYHVDRASDVIGKLPRIYVFDRGYPSGPFLIDMMERGELFIIRLPSTVFKKEQKSMRTDDEWIDIVFDKTRINAQMNIGKQGNAEKLKKTGSINLRFVKIKLSSESDEAAYYLWLLDNGNDFCKEQLDWMKNSETGSVPGVVFAHVPVNDMGNLFEECKAYDEGAVLSGTATYRLNDEIAGGYAEEIILPCAATEEFRVWKDKNVKGAFFGHWHTSGFTGTFDGITMGITYGCQFAKQSPYGMRTIELDENSGELTTKLFIYSDSSFSIQRNKAYAELNDDFSGFIAKIRNFMTFIINSLKYALKF